MVPNHFTPWKIRRLEATQFLDILQHTIILYACGENETSIDHNMMFRNRVQHILNALNK